MTCQLAFLFGNIHCSSIYILTLKVRVGEPSAITDRYIHPPSQIKRNLDFYLNYNSIMKKLFLLLILSFFSAQGYAESCPDGSDPVRSISADGTYFVFNCGAANEAPSSNANSSNTKSNSNQAYQSFLIGLMRHTQES